MDLQERLGQAILDRAAIDQNINDLRDKIEANKFKPFDLAIEVTSKEQAEALFAIFNHSSLTEFVYDTWSSPNASKVRQDISNMTPDFDYNNKFRELMVILGKG